MVEYLFAFQTQHQASFLMRPRLEAYTSPDNPLGYADTSITDDMITHIYSEFSEQSHHQESKEYLHTLTGKFSLFYKLQTTNHGMNPCRPYT